MEETSGEVLKAHTVEEEAQYAKIVKHLKDIKEKVMGEEAKVVNMLGGADGGMGGLGTGGGLLGGLVLGSLLRNGNLLGNGAEAGGHLNNDTMQIMQSLGDIKASIPSMRVRFNWL